MSTRQKRGVKKNSPQPVTKAARVDRIQGPQRPIQGPEEEEDIPDLVDEDSDSEDEDEKEIGLVDEEDDEDDEEEYEEEKQDPLLRLTVLQRANLAAKKQGRQGRQLPVNPNDSRDDVIETSTINNVSLTNYVAHRLTREELQKVESSRVALKS